MGSDDSSLDDLCSVCGHPRRRHDDPPTADCASCSSGWKHEFERKGDLSQGGVEESEKCQHSKRQYTGATYDGPTGKSWVFFVCQDCGEKIKEEELHTETPVEPPLDPEEEEMVQEDRDAHDWRHATPEAGLTCRDCGLAHKFWSGQDCNPGGVAAAEELTRLGQEMEAVPCEPPRRPPYAVAYSAGGAAYEVLLPGDAVAHAEDGVLKISHQGEPVLGIIRVMPVELKERSA